MSELKNTAVFFCKHTNGHPQGPDLNDLVEFAQGLSSVKTVWKHQDFPLPDKNRMAARIREENIDRLVLAGDRPGYIKPLFAGIMKLAGKNPENIWLASFREVNATTKEDAGMAKAVIACAVLGVPFEFAAVPEENDVRPETLVVGGGIAGIQAALEIANAGYKVYLLERTGTIGGHMAMFDKTFPTLDCAACILTPKMVEVGQHPNIELLTYSELKKVDGEPGNFKASILKKARRVSLSKCISCGTCSEKCPASAPSEFDAGTSLRKAIYIPFPQAVPNKYLIDAGACTYVRKGKCGVCAKVCPVEDCINLDEKDEVIDLDVGNIIVATGFTLFDAGRAENFGYGKYANVVTSLEFERLINASGPTEGNIRFRVEDKKGNRIFSPETGEPESVALIHCIGSRDENYNKYCSRVCCMYTLKLAHLVKEKLPGADVFEFFIDMRAFGKGYEEFYQRIKNEGVHIIRGKSAKVEEKDGKLVVRSEDIINQRLLEVPVDMVVLAAGLEPVADAGEISKMLGIETDPDGWFVESNHDTDPVGTFAGGIHVAGLCQGPKDIPDTVAQASAAASKAIQSIMRSRVHKNVRDMELQTILKNALDMSTLHKEKSS